MILQVSAREIGPSPPFWSRWPLRTGSIPPFCVAHAKGITVCIVRDVGSEPPNGWTGQFTRWRWKVSCFVFFWWHIKRWTIILEDERWNKFGKEAVDMDQVIQSDLFYPLFGGHFTFERVTFSPSKKGHQQNCQGVVCVFFRVWNTPWKLNIVHENMPGPKRRELSSNHHFSTILKFGSVGFHTVDGWNPAPPEMVLKPCK